MITSQYSKYQFFRDVKQEYVDADARAVEGRQKKPGIPILTQSSLRLEQFLTTTTTSYEFPVLKGETTAVTTTVQANEVRLAQNDNFHIYSIGIYLAVIGATAPAFRLLTYASEMDLVTVAASLSYQNLWGGTMNINVNQVDVLTNWRLTQHYFVPQTQRLSVTVNTNYDQQDLSQDSLVVCQPTIMLSGAYTNKITIALNAAIASAIAANGSRVVMIFDGLRAQNAAIRK